MGRKGERWGVQGCGGEERGGECRGVEERGKVGSGGVGRGGEECRGVEGKGEVQRGGVGRRGEWWEERGEVGRVGGGVQGRGGVGMGGMQIGHGNSLSLCGSSGRCLCLDSAFCRSPLLKASPGGTRRDNLTQHTIKGTYNVLVCGWLGRHHPTISISHYCSTECGLLHPVCA